MATSTKTADEAQAWNPTDPCPTCKEPVQVYLPPERSVAGPQAYPALLLHFEKAHPRVAPPRPPVADEWDATPPAPEDWKPLDRLRAEKGMPQPEGVWPPVRAAALPV